MLNLTKYQQKINKTMVVFANYVFVIWLKKLLAFIIFGNKTKKIIALFVAIFGIILLLWQFHFKEVLSDANPPYVENKRHDAFVVSGSDNFPVASSPIKIDRLGYTLTKLYYPNGVDYFRCANQTEKANLQYYCDKSLLPNNDLSGKNTNCTSSPSFCTEEQVFSFQTQKRESFYKRSPGEKIIRLVKEYHSSQETILTDYRIAYLPPYDQLGLLPTDSSGVLIASGATVVASPLIRILSGATQGDYTGRVSNLPACKAGATLLDIGNTCMLKIEIDDTDRSKIATNNFDFSGVSDYCHEKTLVEPILGKNCRLPACLSISKEYYRRPGINCLADCNATDIFGGNGIDDANLKYPGINCLPACETGLKTTSYLVDLTTNSLLPKDIGASCFLKHQGYVMPVCNNTPLVGFSDGSHSQQTNVIKSATIAKNPPVPRKDCMNASDLPLCAFFIDKGASIANKFGCLGMVKQTISGSAVFVDNEYVLGTNEINKTTTSQYDENPALGQLNSKNIPIINYALPSSSCSVESTDAGCGKPYNYSKLAQEAKNYIGDYNFNVDMIVVQDGVSPNIEDVLNHDSLNESDPSNSLRFKPFGNTARPVDTSTPTNVFSVRNDNYKIKATLDPYYRDPNKKPSCSLLTKQELKFIGTRNCDLNQIWSDTNGGKNSRADMQNGVIGFNGQFCQGEYFCKVDTRCSMFSDEQLQEAKAFFHCLPAQYTSYEKSKPSDDIKCNALNDLEILALTKTTIDSSAPSAPKLELNELNNFITKACFRGNLAFLIHKRVDHNISGVTGDSGYNLPDYTKINSPSFYDEVISASNLASLTLLPECKYLDESRISYMFTVTDVGSTPNVNPTCLHSNHFSCQLDSYKKACYLLGTYKFKNIDDFFKGIVNGSNDRNIENKKPASCEDLARDCEINYALNTLGTLDCFTDSTIALTEERIEEIRKCNVNPLLLAVFVPNAKSIPEIESEKRYKPLTSNNTDCSDCFCDPINIPANSEHKKFQAKYETGGGLVSDFTIIVNKNSCVLSATPSCFICYKPNVYEGLIKDAHTNKHGTATKYYPFFTIFSPMQISNTTPSASGRTDNANTMGYYQYEDPFYSWFFFPKPNTNGSKETQTVRDCGSGQKCYKAFTVDFPNSRNNDGNDKGELDNNNNKLNYKTFPPIYYYGNGNFGDDIEKEKYNLVSSPQGLDSGVTDRTGTHSINKIASPGATALKGSIAMGKNPYGVYNYSSSFDREWLCGMNRNVGGAKLPNEDTFAYFAPVLVESGRFGLKPNNRYKDNRRFAFSDTKWNDTTKKLEHHVNICLRYESASAPGACGRRECRIDNPLGIMWCGEDQCRKFIVQEPEIGQQYSKCHLLYQLNMTEKDGIQQPAWFINDLESLIGKTDPISLYKDGDEEIATSFLNIDNGLPSDYYKCAKLYSAPTLEHGKKAGKALAAVIVGLLSGPFAPLTAGAVATSAIWNYTDHRVRAFYDSGHVCAELDFYGIDLDTYSRNKEDMNNAKSFELPNGGKICYGGRVLNGGNCEFANGSFNTFVNLDTNMGGMPGATDPTVWRVVRKIKFVGNVSDDANVSFLGYSVPDVADTATNLKYNESTGVANLFPHQISANRGIITMTYDHNTRMTSLKKGVSKQCKAGAEANCNEIFGDDIDNNSEKNPNDAKNKQYGLLQSSRGKKNPYYGFNGYYGLYPQLFYPQHNPVGNWLSTSLPTDWNLCFFGIPDFSLKVNNCPVLASLAKQGSCPIGYNTYNGDCKNKVQENYATDTHYIPNFMPNNFLKEKVWLKSDCVPVQRRIGLPLNSAIANPDNSPNLFSPEPMVFAVKINNIWKKATEIQENVDKVDFSDPEIALKYGDKYYYLKLPNQYASLVKCHPTTISTSSGNVLYSFNNIANDNNKFILKPLDLFFDEDDLLSKLNTNFIANEIFSGGVFSDDDTSFKKHHNTNLDGNRDSALSNISTICDSTPQPNSTFKPYGVMISSQLNIAQSGEPVPLYAQIFVKKEQKEGLPVLCVYRGSVDNNKPAVVLRDSDLKNVACFARQQPDLNKMKLIKENQLDDSGNLFLDQQVQFQYKYSGATFENIAEMFTTKASSSFSEKYSLKTTKDSLIAAKNTGFIEDISYFEGMQISSARHACTALNLDCVDNEREIQTICNANKLICNRSTVVTKQDFSGLNESINNNNYSPFMSSTNLVNSRQSLFRMLEIREFCLRDLLSYCNNLNGYTLDDIKSDPKINTLHPNFNNRISPLISDSAKNSLGWNNKICLKQGLQNIMPTNQWVKQITTGLAERAKGKRDVSDTANYDVSILPAGNIRPAEPHEYKPNLTGTPNLCVEIGGGLADNPKLVDFCEATSYPLKFEKYKNFNTNFVNKIDLIQQGNIRYQGLIGTDYSRGDSDVSGIDISHQNRKDGIIITGDLQTANAEIDVSFKGDSGIYGVCNGFWKNKNIDTQTIKYQCNASNTLVASNTLPACERFSCPDVIYGVGDNLNQPASDGLYHQNGNVTGLDVAKNRGYASWAQFTKTTDFIENVNNSSCLVGFAKKDSLIDSSCFDGSVCASSSSGNTDANNMITAICPTASTLNCSASDSNVYTVGLIKTSTHCNQFGYWRFDWNEEFRKAHIANSFTDAGEAVLNSCQRIKCSITDLEDKFKDVSGLNKTPVRLIKQRCSYDGLIPIIVAELNNQADRTLYIDKYYYLKTNNLANCKIAQKLRIVLNAIQYLESTPPIAASFVDITIPTTASGYNNGFDLIGNTKVIAWYFKVVPTNIIENSSFAFTTEGTKATVSHEKLLKVWSRIAGFQPNTDSRTSIPAMRNKKIEHAKIGGEKTSVAIDDDDYDTEGKCLASLGYRAISIGINPKLMCNYQGILKVKQPCVSTCDAVDDVMANNDSHGYAQWADTENKIKICGDRCSPITTKIPFSYVSKSVEQRSGASVCVDNKKPYPYPPFRSSEGVKFEFIDGLLSSLSAQTINHDSSSTQNKDLYSISNLSSCLTGSDGCVVQFDKANISENVKLLSSGSEFNLYKKDSVGGQERFAPYDILPNVKYKITQIPDTSYYYATLLQSKKLTEDARWQEYNINKRKIFVSSDCSLNGTVINCSCDVSGKPLCPFENVGDKISEGEVVEINLSSALVATNSYSLKFTKGDIPPSTIPISIFSSFTVSHLVLQMKKNSTGLWQWEVVNVSGNYNGLKRLLLGTTFTASIPNTSCVQTTIVGGLASSDYNCTLTLTPPTGITTPLLSNNQEIKINFGSTAPAVGNSSDNYKIKYNTSHVKKYNSQGNLIDDFNYQELSGEYILRAIYNSRNTAIDYYLLINAKDFKSQFGATSALINNYPTPSRTCRYGIGNVWSLPDSACQNSCPGLSGAVSADGKIGGVPIDNIINSNDFDSRIGATITEHKIKIDASFSLTQGDYLSVSSGSPALSRNKIAVKVVNVDSVNSEAILHVIWPQLDYNKDVTLILQKDGDTYKIIQGNPDLSGGNVISDDPSLTNANTFSAQHYETDDIKNSIVLYRRCGSEGKWQDPISLCPIAGPAKGKNATGLYSINSILGFVSGSAIEPDYDHSPKIEAVRASTDFNFNVSGMTNGVLKQTSLQKMSNASSDFYRLSDVDVFDAISEIPVIPDYRIGGGSGDKFRVWNNIITATVESSLKNIYAYAMCNYNYANLSNTYTPDANGNYNDIYYNFYNSDFGGGTNNGWGTNQKYQCQNINTNNYLNTYKIAPTPGSSPCSQQCNSSIIKRVGVTAVSNVDDDFGSSTLGGIDYSVPSTATKAYFVNDGYSQYNHISLNGVYNFYSGQTIDLANKIKLFEIFGSITADNCATMSNSQSGRCNLFEKALGSADEFISGVVLQSQCNNQMGVAVSPQVSVASGNGAISEIPTLYSKYCWGLTRSGSSDLNPKAICQANGKFSLENPFKGKQQAESTRFKYSAFVGSDVQVGRHEISNGIVKEIFFNYGDLRIENSGGWSCGGKDMNKMCDSHFALFKQDRYNYDNTRSLGELQWGQIECPEGSCGVCSCWDAIKDHSVHRDFGNRTTSYHINLLSNDGNGLLSLAAVTAGSAIKKGQIYFNNLCESISNTALTCKGFSSDAYTDPIFSERGKNILSNNGQDISSSHHKSLRVIMWGCATNYSTTYDYNANKCIGSAGGSFNPSSFYPTIPTTIDKKCATYSLSHLLPDGNMMIDEFNPALTSVDLGKGGEKILACKNGYDVTLNSGQTSPSKITCTDVDSSFVNAAGASISPVSTSNFTCQPSGCNVATITAFCNENKINCSSIANIANDATIRNLQCEAPEQAKSANNLVCNLGRINYASSFDPNKLCGTSCTYTKVNATKDGFGFGTTTVSELSVDLPMRLDGVVDFSCLTGFSPLSPDGTAATTAPTITCANSPSGPQIQYGENRCISSTNYCTLNSSTSGAGDVDFSNTDCHQPGILCKKTGSITNSILVSTGQNAIVNCADGASGTKTRTCQSQNDGTWSGSCTANTCTAPSSPAGYTLPAGFTYNYTTTSTAITGSSCASGYSDTPQYTCNATSVGSSTPATLSGCTINQCNVLLTNGATSTTKYNYNTSLSSILADTTADSVACNTGYSKPTLSGNFTACTTNNATINIGACAINTCTAPSSPIGYTLPPAVFTYKYTTTATAIAAGSSCANGYIGTPQYTCNATSVGSSTPARLSGCNARCEWLSNITGQWVDAIVMTKCGTGCETEDGCRTQKCNNSGGLYRWEQQEINCNR